MALLTWAPTPLIGVAIACSVKTHKTTFSLSALILHLLSVRVCWGRVYDEVHPDLRPHQHILELALMQSSLLSPRIEEERMKTLTRLLSKREGWHQLDMHGLL